MVDFLSYGEVFLLIALILSVINCRKTNKKMSSLNCKLQAILSGRFGFVGLLDLDGKVLQVNKAALEFASVSEQDVVGKCFWDCPWWTHSNEEQLKIQQAVLDGARGRFVRFETNHLNQKGEIRIVDFSLTPFYGNNGGVIYLIPEGRDVTRIVNSEEEKLAMEKKLNQARKMEAIGVLAGGIAHEFNNNLTVILGQAELLGFNFDKDSNIFKRVNQIIIAGGRARDLVKQILTFSRYSDVEKRAIHIDITVKETLKMVRSSIPSSVEIVKSLPLLTTKPVIADPGKIHQILTNLITNAVHAMEEKGEIHVLLEDVSVSGDLSKKLEISGDYVHLAVTDKGCGITQEVKERMFDPFYSTKGIGTGTGIGLSVVDGIVKDMKGIIYVDTKHEEGTTFCVYLPVAKEECFLNKEIEKFFYGKGERIMLVDDEPMVADVGKAMLESLGYYVTVFNRPLAALSYFTDHLNDFDLLMTDQSMPVLTGEELIKEFNVLSPNIPKIIYTGHSNVIDEKKSRKIGVNAFMMKPFHLASLSKTVKEVLELN